jgi:hypothetical protein
VQGPEDVEFYICNGIQSSKVYKLDPAATTDDGATIDFLYTTSGLPELSKRAQMQGLGNNRTRSVYMNVALQSLGNVPMRLLPNRLFFPEPAGYGAWTMAGGFSPGNPSLYDCETSLNFAASRTFIEFRENDGLGGFSLSNLTIQMRKDIWNAQTGLKTGGA